MRPDTATHLAAAARQRHELARAKAIRALRELDRAGTATTFEAVARAASVSRSWLYTQPDIRGEIQRLRNANRRAPSHPYPPRSEPPPNHFSDAWKPPTNASANSPRTTSGYVANSPKHSETNEPQEPRPTARPVTLR